MRRLLLRMRGGAAGKRGGCAYGGSPAGAFSLRLASACPSGPGSAGQQAPQPGGKGKALWSLRALEMKSFKAGSKTHKPPDPMKILRWDWEHGPCCNGIAAFSAQRRPL